MLVLSLSTITVGGDPDCQVLTGNPGTDRYRRVLLHGTLKRNAETYLRLPERGPQDGRNNAKRVGLAIKKLFYGFATVPDTV